MFYTREETELKKDLILSLLHHRRLENLNNILARSPKQILLLHLYTISLDYAVQGLVFVKLLV